MRRNLPKKRQMRSRSIQLQGLGFEEQQYAL
jgi:hypothetical protein